MNKKIQEFVEKATRNVESVNSYHSVVFDKEKFAKLIILECAKLADCPNSFKHRSGQKIRKYFGVEA